MKRLSTKLDEQFFNQFKATRRFKKKQLIIGPNAQFTSIFYIKTGFVRQYLISKDGKEITFNILKPGTYFSMICALNDVPNIYFYESLTDVTFLKAPKKELVNFLKENPEILIDLTKRTLNGLDGITRLMAAVLTGSAHEQITSVLLVLARRFGRKSNTNEVTIDIPLTHRVIGTLAGLSRESTSLELEKLAKKGIIFKNTRLIIIKDFKKLENESPIKFIESNLA